jgi:hypothetical protein
MRDDNTLDGWAKIILNKPTEKPQLSKEESRVLYYGFKDNLDMHSDAIELEDHDLFRSILTKLEVLGEVPLDERIPDNYLVLDEEDRRELEEQRSGR